jgi:hypothetical protein
MVLKPKVLNLNSNFTIHPSFQLNIVKCLVSLVEREFEPICEGEC